WASTENLGAWPIARKRLLDALQAEISAPLASNNNPAASFAPFAGVSESDSSSYFKSFGEDLAAASNVYWSSEHPVRLSWTEGEYSWPLREQSSIDEEGILFTRRFAMDEAGANPSSLAELAERSEGSARWGILRGDVDHFDVQLR